MIQVPLLPIVLTVVGVFWVLRSPSVVAVTVWTALAVGSWMVWHYSDRIVAWCRRQIDDLESRL